MKRTIARLGGEVIESDIEIVGVGTDEGDGSCCHGHDAILRMLHLDLAEHPGDTFVLFDLGMLHFDLGNYFHAECYLNECLQQSSPRDFCYRTAARRLVESHVRKGDTHRAREVAEHVQRQQPEDTGFREELDRLVPR